MTYMFILLSIGLVFTYSLVKNEIVAKNLVRKVFHILSVVLFVPGIYLNVRGSCYSSMNRLALWCLHSTAFLCC